MSYVPAQHGPCKVDNWTVSTELVTYTAQQYPKLNLERAYERFCNHHRGRATRSSSWDAAFLNWLEQDADRQGEHLVGGTDYKGLPNDTAADWKKHLMGRDGS